MSLVLTSQEHDWVAKCSANNRWHLRKRSNVGLKDHCSQGECRRYLSESSRVQLMGQPRVFNVTGLMEADLSFSSLRVPGDSACISIEGSKDFPWHDHRLVEPVDVFQEFVLACK